jgi:hypothetical protein
MTASSASRWSPVAISCDHSNELSGSKKSAEFLAQGALYSVEVVNTKRLFRFNGVSF